MKRAFLSASRVFSLGRRPICNGVSWWGLSVAALVLALQACNGSGGSSAKKLDASTDGPGGAVDAGLDAVSNRDGNVGVDAGPADTARQESSMGAEVGALDVLGGDVKDVAGASEVGAVDAVTYVDGDGATKDRPPMGALDASTLDMGGETWAGSFSCPLPATPDSGVTQQLCYDFSDPASAADFTPEAGTWEVSDGTYNATAPAAQVTCPGGAFGGSGMTASVLNNLSAQDVRVHALMTSVLGPDKELVLRSRPGGNRIELNFRANFTYQGVAQGGDLYISELVDCVNSAYVDVGTILIPHAVGQAIAVDVELIGQHLTVVVDGNQVFDNTLSVSTVAGSVGFAVFRDEQTVFDDLLVDVLK
jgi:hypothetical protein